LATVTLSSILFLGQVCIALPSHRRGHPRHSFFVEVECEPPAPHRPPATEVQESVTPSRPSEERCGMVPAHPQLTAHDPDSVAGPLAYRCGNAAPGPDAYTSNGGEIQPVTGQERRAALRPCSAFPRVRSHCSARGRQLLCLQHKRGRSPRNESHAACPRRCGCNGRAVRFVTSALVTNRTIVSAERQGYAGGEGSSCPQGCVSQTLRERLRI
jgi:hypothetical protein